MVHQYGSDEDWDRYAKLTGDPGWAWKNVKNYVMKVLQFNFFFFFLKIFFILTGAMIEFLARESRTCKRRTRHNWAIYSVSARYQRGGLCQSSRLQPDHRRTRHGDNWAVIRISIQWGHKWRRPQPSRDWLCPIIHWKRRQEQFID